MRHGPIRRPQGPLTAVAIGIATLAGLVAACGPVIKRNLSNLPPGQVGFDDLCGLQAYFDRIVRDKVAPPATVGSSEIESGAKRSGRTRFRFEGEALVPTVKAVLTQNWARLPPGLDAATSVDIEVRWSDRGGLRRVVTNEDASLIIGDKRRALPYHVCLSDLLFGEPIYRQRRELLGLPPLGPSHPPTADANDGSAGIRENIARDGGAGGDVGQSQQGGAGGAIEPPGAGGIGGARAEQPVR